jgi:hypothetical protein
MRAEKEFGSGLPEKSGLWQGKQAWIVLPATGL